MIYIPLRYGDGFRAAISMIVALPILIWPLVERLGTGSAEPLRLISAGCMTLAVSFLLYILWTHVLFARTDPLRLREIAEVQHRRGASRLAKAFGVASTESWAISAATTALIGSLAAAIYGGEATGLSLTIVVMFTAVTAWATVVYAYALKYLRIEAHSRSIAYTIPDEPRFEDALTMAAMISAAGSTTAATPKTREALRAVRTHTVIAFAFNALVIAMAVSLISGLVQNV